MLSMNLFKQFLRIPARTVVLMPIAAATIGIAAPTIAHQQAQAPKNPMGEMQMPTVAPSTPMGEMKMLNMAPPKMDKSPMGGHQDGHHHHQTIAIPAGQPIPKVTLKVTPDAIRGWNMQILLQDFSFTPEQVNQVSTTTDGHAHLMLNGRKIARLYGTWYHIDRLPPGKNELKVTLNTNKHEELTERGKTIAATAIVEVPADPAVKNEDLQP